MENLPPGVAPYQRTAVFTERTVPKGLLKEHSTKAGTWGRIVVDSGALLLRFVASGEEVRLAPGVDGIVAPEQIHQVTPVSAVRFFVEFCR